MKWHTPSLPPAARCFAHPLAGGIARGRETPATAIAGWPAPRPFDSWGFTLCGWRAASQTCYDAHEDLPAQMRTKPWLPQGLGFWCGNGTIIIKALSARRRRSYCRDRGIARTLEPLNGRLCVFRNRPTDEDFNLYDIARSKTARSPKAVCYAGALTQRRGLERINACYQAGATLCWPVL